jgi:hypothetical protein
MAAAFTGFCASTVLIGAKSCESTPYKIFYGQLLCFSKVWHLEQSHSSATTHVVSTSQNRKPAALIFPPCLIKAQ